MNRREFITLLGAAAAWPLAGLAQEVGKVRRIGFLRVGEPPAAFIDGFRRGLREVGLVEGRDYVIEFALPQHTAQVPAAAAELVRRRVDILLASGTPSVLPARDAAGHALRARRVAERDWIELAVADTGIGMTAEQQANCSRSLPRRIGQPRSASARNASNVVDRLR
jgi:hypothetical protein